jgi:hypothetical protein
MPIELITPTSKVDLSADVNSKDATDRSLAEYQAKQKASEIALAAKEAAEKAAATKYAKEDEAEAYQKAKEARASIQTAQYASLDAEKLQKNKDELEKTLAEKTDLAVVSQRAAKAAAARKADSAHNENSKLETEQAIETYQTNRDAREVAQADMASEAARIAETGVNVVYPSPANTTHHVDLKD